MSELDLAAIAARVAAATEAYSGIDLRKSLPTKGAIHERFMEVLADVPALLAEVERLNGTLSGVLRALPNDWRKQYERAEKAEALVAEKDAEIERLTEICRSWRGENELLARMRDEARAALADVTRERDDLRARVEAPSPGNCKALSDGGQVCERRYGHTGNHEAVTMLGRYIRWAEDASRGGVMDTLTDNEGGLEARYHVQKINDPTGKHDECRYFVLDPQHDPIAERALRRYASFARDEGLVALADDLDAWVGTCSEGMQPHGSHGWTEITIGGEVWTTCPGRPDSRSRPITPSEEE